MIEGADLPRPLTVVFSSHSRPRLCVSLRGPEGRSHAALWTGATATRLGHGQVRYPVAAGRPLRMSGGAWWGDSGMLVVLIVPEGAHFGAGCQKKIERSFGLDPAILEHHDVIGPA